MTCSYTGRPVPTEKLFVLYYPPSAAHETWDKSVYAAARAREALGGAVDELETFFGKYVMTNRFLPGLLATLAGLGALGFWAYQVFATSSDPGVVIKYLIPAVGAIALLFGRFRMKRFFGRLGSWRASGKETIAAELEFLKEKIAELPDDPDAEEAASLMRRECPEVVSEIAFQGAAFRAFTYLDFVLFPKLQHPSEKEDLPAQHSLYRDAYYVGDVVYDSWRVFQRDRRGVEDPRFVGSGGRRGVI